MHMYNVGFFTCMFTTFRLSLLLTEVTNGFGLLVRWPEDPQERLLAFRVTGDEKDKTNLINQLSGLVAQSSCSVTPVSLIF